ncbi:MAG TPA: alanine racemase [Dehalococcoidia bacterium]
MLPGDPLPGRPAWAEIDLDALTENVRALKDQARPAGLIAMVKANAYGHGAVMVARAAVEAGADRLGVTCVDEGVELREGGVTAPILILGHTPPHDAERTVRYDLTPTVNGRDLADALSRHAVALGRTVPVHVKLDSGMNRYGLPEEGLLDLAAYLRRLPGLQVEGLYTHFAAADEADKAFTREQFRRFQAVAARLPWIPLRHAANTAGLLDLPETALDFVRCGIGLYGYYPSDEVRRDAPLRPVLSLKSRLVRLRRLEPGETVGYGRTWTARRPSLVGLAAVGYGDGYRRALSNRAHVLVRGRRAPVAGRVSMDQTTIDITDVPGVQEGDEVVFIGTQGEEVVTADELAALCDTISYEILTGISARVPRVYLRQGRVVAVQSLVQPPAAVPR